MDNLDPSKMIVHCRLDKLRYEIAELKKIGQKVLLTEMMGHNHVYIVAIKAFKAIEDKK